MLVTLAVGAFVKGITGAGLPQLAIPVMALFVGIEQAVIVMSIPGLVSNIWLVVEHRKSAPETRDLPVQLGTGIIGTAVGTVLLTSIDGRWLSVGLAVLIVCYVVLRLTNPRATLGPGVSRWLSPPVGLASGGLQGATGVSGPLLSTYNHSLGLSPSAFIFSISTLFLVFSLVQVVTLAALGAYTAELLVQGVLAVLPVAVMLPLGSRVARRIPAEAFSKLILVTLLAAAGALVWQALA